MSEVIERSAPGKIILCGEHSVVYNRPAIAVPVSALRAHARIEPTELPGLRIFARDLRQTIQLATAAPQNPLAKIARLVLDHLDAIEPNATLTLQSDLPIAAGLGSGAAVTAAVARVLNDYLGGELSREALSALTYEVEKIHHGNPSGIDNTVVVYEQPVYFVKGQPPETFTIGAPFDLLIANSGIASSTREAVAEMYQRWQISSAYYDIIFNCAGTIANAARSAIEEGAHPALGTLLDENHELLMKMGVSLPRLDQMVIAARAAGAWGAKLTGSGQGGNIIALIPPERRTEVAIALREAGAVKVWHTRIGERDV